MVVIINFLLKKFLLLKNIFIQCSTFKNVIVILKSVFLISHFAIIIQGLALKIIYRFMLAAFKSRPITNAVYQNQLLSPPNFGGFFYGIFLIGHLPENFCMKKIILFSTAVVLATQLMAQTTKKMAPPAPPPPPKTVKAPQPPPPPPPPPTKDVKFTPPVIVKDAPPPPPPPPAPPKAPKKNKALMKEAAPAINKL